MWALQPGGALLHGGDFKLLRPTAALRKHRLPLVLVQSIQTHVDQEAAQETGPQAQRHHGNCGRESAAAAPRRGALESPWKQCHAHFIVGRFDHQRHEKVSKKSGTNLIVTFQNKPSSNNELSK